MRIRWIRWIFWKLRHETNPRNKSFWKWLDSWSTIRNDSFQVRIRDPRYESNLFKSRFVTYESIRIHVFTNLLYDSRILKIIIWIPGCEDLKFLVIPKNCFKMSYFQMPRGNNWFWRPSCPEWRPVVWNWKTKSNFLNRYSFK